MTVCEGKICSKGSTVHELGAILYTHREIASTENILQLAYNVSLKGETIGDR